MITAELEILKQRLIDNNPIFGNNVFIFSRFEENDYNFQGLTDQYDNYAFLEIVDTDDETFTFEAFEGLTGKGGYNITTSIELIAVFDCVNLENAIEKLISDVVGLGNTVIKSASINSELIYFDRTGEELEAKKQIAKVLFDFQTIKSFQRCITDIC